MTDKRGGFLRAAIILLAGVVCAPAAALAHGGTFGDIWQGVFQGAGACNNCHGPGGGAQSGGMITQQDFSNPEVNESSWYSELVGQRSTRGSRHGKLRVTPYEPWNSYLLDKLTGDLKLGEGRPMPFGGRGYVHNCPGAIDKLTKWILDGAPRQGWVDGDVYRGQVKCDSLYQPAFAAPVPAGALQALTPQITVSEPARELEQTVSIALGNGADALVGRIEIVASAGTEYVEVTREGDSAPLAVARGSHLDLTLPADVAVRLTAGQEIVIRQRIRNDFWPCAQNPVPANCTSFKNETNGRAAVNFYPVADAGAVAHEAQPFIDATGTSVLFAPPRLLGGSGGLWIGADGLNGATVGIWSDQRLLEAGIVDGAGATMLTTLTKPEITTGYTALPGDSSLGAIAYQCTHSNGFTNTNENAESLGLLIGTTSIVNRPLKFGCGEIASPHPLLTTYWQYLGTAGTPALVGGPAKDCLRSIHDTSTNPPAAPYNDTECAASPIDSCLPANLVGGPGVNDGRCALIGLSW